MSILYTCILEERLAIHFAQNL